jgi:hypothetical protein
MVAGSISGFVSGSWRLSSSTTTSPAEALKALALRLAVTESMLVRHHGVASLMRSLDQPSSAERCSVSSASITGMAILLFGTLVGQPQPFADWGLLLHAPENTLVSYRACLELRLRFEVAVRRYHLLPTCQFTLPARVDCRDH